MAEAPVDLGTPAWDDKHGLVFIGEKYSERASALSGYNSAYRQWEAAVNGSDPLRIIHDRIKASAGGGDIGKKALAEAQAVLIGATHVTNPNEAIIHQLKQAYAIHIGPETTKLIERCKVLHEHNHVIGSLQLSPLQNARTLPGMIEAEFGSPERPGTKRAMVIAQHEDRLRNLNTSRARLAKYLEEIPGIQTAHTARSSPHDSGHSGSPIERTMETLEPQADHLHGSGAAKAASALEQQAGHIHSDNKWLIASGLFVAAGLGFGAYILNKGNKKAPEKLRTTEPIKAETVQLGAAQPPVREIPRWTSLHHMDVSEPSTTIEK